MVLENIPENFQKKYVWWEDFRDTKICRHCRKLSIVYVSQRNCILVRVTVFNRQLSIPVLLYIVADNIAPTLFFFTQQKNMTRILYYYNISDERTDGFFWGQGILQKRGNPKERLEQ